MNIQNYKIFEIESTEGIEQYLELKQNGLPVIPKIELERSAIGPKAKQDMGKLLKMFSETDPETIINELNSNGSFTFQIEQNSIVLDKEDFIVDFDVDEKHKFAKRPNLVVMISLERDSEMMAKGLIKDLARRLQTLRKERGYNPTDILSKASILDLDSESLDLIKEKTDEISFLVRVKQVDFEESCKEYKDDDIDGMKIRISVE
jgi:isoleucyl-tRNA synthetase